MKAVPLAFHGVLLGLLSTSISVADPVLATPGTASWQNKEIGTGIRTEFTLTGNTVLNWERLNLKSGSEMDFNFVDGNSVLNVLTGGKTHYINGAVTSNGNIGFVSPNASLVVGGSIRARSVTLSTLNVDPTDFADGGSMTLEGGAAKPRFLNIRGEVRARIGDALVAGSLINIDPDGLVRAKNGSVLYAAGESVDVKKVGDKRLSVSGSGNFSHSGTTRGSRMEVAAGTNISNAGRFGSGYGQIFFSVGENGKISNQGRGIMAGSSIAANSGIITNGEILSFDEDSASFVTNSSLAIPGIKNLDGSQASRSQSITSNSPTSSSIDAQRVSSARTGDRNSSGGSQGINPAGMRGGKSTGRAVVKADASKSILRRSSFFGARGGSRVAAR